jgi:hypothetical protein
MKFLNRSELAKEFSVNLTTIDNWVRKGCPASKKNRQWRFNLEEVTQWRNREQDTDNPPEGITGNGIRDFSTIAIKHFILWLINEMGPAWSGMMKENGLDPGLTKKLWVFNYILMDFRLKEYLKKDMFNRAIGNDLDKIWNSVCLKPLQKVKTYPTEIDLKIPESIKLLLQDKDISNAAKKFCKG